MFLFCFFLIILLLFIYYLLHAIPTFPIPFIHSYIFCIFYAFHHLNFCSAHRVTISWPVFNFFYSILLPPTIYSPLSIVDLLLPRQFSHKKQRKTNQPQAHIHSQTSLGNGPLLLLCVVCELVFYYFIHSFFISTHSFMPSDFIHKTDYSLPPQKLSSPSLLYISQCRVYVIMVSSSSLTIDDRKIPKEQQQQTLLMKPNAKKKNE